MNQQKFAFSKSIAVKWMVSYAVIMLIPLIVSAIIYMQTKQIVEYEIRRASEAMLKQVKYMVDSEVNQAEKLAMQLSINSDVNKFLKMSPLSERSESFQIYKIRQELGKYKSTNDFIKGIYLYSGKLDKILTDETYTDTRTFYDINHQLFAASYPEWLETIKNPSVHANRQMSAMTFERSGDTVFLLKSLTAISESNTASSSLLFPLNSATVQTMLENVDWVNKGEVYILDQQNHILFRNNKGSNAPVFTYAASEDGKMGTSFLEIDGAENMVSFVTSDTTDWRYISVFPSKVFWEKARDIRTMNLLGLLACFLIGGAVIYFFARRNYNPVRELVHVFSLSGKKEAKPALDEFSFIREHALAALKERDDMSSRQHKQLRVVQAYYLARMLKGQVEEAGSVQEAAALYHLNWRSDHFAVLLFFIQPLEEDAPSAELSNFIVSNIIMDNVGELHSLSFTEMDGMLTAIINIHPERLEYWKEDMEQALAKTLEFIGRRYRLQIVMAGSGRQLGLAGMHQAYLQALGAQEYRLLLEENVSIWYEDIEPVGVDYHFSINNELAFINVVKTGDLDKATELMDEILHSLFNNQSSIEMLKYTMIDLASSIMKSAPAGTGPEQQGDKWRPLKHLLACTTRADFRKELLLILEMTCGRINERKSLLSNPGIGEQVAVYVKRNYMDVNLSVSMIGAEFGINAQYVSRLFKEQMGQGLYDFINQTRISEAKLFLQQGISIEEVSVQTGFSSSNAFIRVFKKYEGLTPGKYKNIQ
ncbi:hypothetical protein GCM10010912_27680 [Paenibacillus albidus]|uniref:HTH araC/xylS-type domain-containing protein n=1 Tax=Paenibacillus albidus TaxID=2041023 RepID=A0A917CA05_9BACL|nr:helix-turn-helix domain-containing protein [Paenibacillus albidus]GGF81048.1 hypothetical protein GCM10010912_27680 [Paenibacillus albidus]